mmetsp:Transcript_51021/g.115746  ORF Transcript_51021/g.115746 Transcript_51021/m.115746 type:complete len:144 (-) Transcript_51021:1675-2106(-)
MARLAIAEDPSRPWEPSRPCEGAFVESKESSSPASSPGDAAATMGRVGGPPSGGLAWDGDFFDELLKRGRRIIIERLAMLASAGEAEAKDEVAGRCGGVGGAEWSTAPPGGALSAAILVCLEAAFTVDAIEAVSAAGGGNAKR